MRKLLVLLTLGIVLSANSHEAFRFAVYEPGFPPFIYIEDKQSDITGIVPRLMVDFAGEQQISVEYVMDNRKGGEQRLYDGSVDAMLISPEWAKHPDQLLFTDAILPYDDYLFTRATGDNQSPLPGSTVCTREYYVYPTLEEAFKRGAMLRLDASSQQAQLRMLEKSRCDFAYINDLVAYWLIGRHFPTLKLTKIPDYKASTALKIALNPRWKSHLPALNAFIKRSKDSGKLNQIVMDFTGKPLKN
jgi:polar amino acid transport system substrate-binding protein